ncbi:MAG: hypothetical protein ABID35_05405 [Candidatus Margulisiibacteriota bacterium]
MVANMSIAPIQPRRSAPAFRRQALGLRYYGARQSYTLQSGRNFGIAFIMMAGLSLVGKATMAALVTGFEVVGLAKQGKEIAKMDTKNRELVPKGGLITRAAAWTTLGATILYGGYAISAAAAAGTPVSPVIALLWLGGITTSLITLGVEKIVRGVKRRSVQRQIINATRTPADAQTLAGEIRDANVPASEQTRLAKQMLRSVNDSESREAVEVLIRELPDVQLSKLAQAARQAEINLVRPERS